MKKFRSHYNPVFRYYELQEWRQSWFFGKDETSPEGWYMSQSVPVTVFQSELDIAPYLVAWLHKEEFTYNNKNSSVLRQEMLDKVMLEVAKSTSEKEKEELLQMLL